MSQDVTASRPYANADAFDMGTARVTPQPRSGASGAGLDSDCPSFRCKHEYF
jgi:hypothetical protein